MNRLDILMVLLAIASYIAIKVDAKSYDTKVHRYEELRDKQKAYLDRMITIKTINNAKRKNS